MLFVSAILTNGSRILTSVTCIHRNDHVTGSRTDWLSSADYRFSLRLGRGTRDYIVLRQIGFDPWIVPASHTVSYRSAIV